MADVIGTSKFLLEYEVDASKAKKALTDLKTQLHDLYVTTDTSNKSLGIDKELNEAINAARQLHGILENSTTSTGKLDLTDFTQGLKQSGRSLEEYNTLLNKLGPTGTAAMQNVTQEILKADTKVNVLSGSLKKFFDGLKNTAMWAIQSKAVHAVESAISGAYSYAQKLNGSLNDIRIVTGYSADKMADFAKQANKAAKSLSTTTNEYVKGSLIFYQQGLSDEVVKQRTDTTIKLANTSGESAEDISSYMTSIWNNFDDGSKSVEYYADALSYLGAASAATNADIAEGLQYFASTASTVGLSYEYAAGALTTLVDVTQQSASTIGNSLKTIFARLESVSLGETLDDDVTLTKYTNALNDIGVSVLDTNGNLRDMDDILDDMAEKWETLENSQQVAVAQTVGGVRQYNNLISLMENYDKFKRFVSGASDSEGYLQQQADIYEESWAAASDRVEAAWESLYTQIIDDKTLIAITNIIEKIVTGISDVMKGMGGLKGALPAIFLLIQRVYKEGNSFAIQLKQTMDLVNKVVNQYDLTKENEKTQDQALGVRDANIQLGVDTSQTALSWDVKEAFAQYREKYNQLNPGEKVEYADIMDRVYHQWLESAKISTKITKTTQEILAKEEEFGISYEGNDLQTKMSQQRNASLFVEQIRNSKNHYAAAKDVINTISASPIEIPLSKEFKTLLTEIVNGNKGNGGAYKKLYNIPKKEANAIENDMEDLASKIKESLVKNIKDNLLDENNQVKKDVPKEEAVATYVEMKEQAAALDGEAHDNMETLLEQYKTANNLVQEQINKQKQVNAERKKGASYAQEQNEKERQYQQITNVVSLVSAISQGLSAIDGLVDSIKEGDVSIASLVGSFGSLWMAIKMIRKEAAEFATESTLAGKIVGASWWQLTLILAVVQVALWGLKKLVDWFIAQTPEKKLEAATEAANNAASAASNLASEYDNVIDKLEKFEEISNTFDTLTRGTTEWSEALADVNEIIDDLIETYGLVLGEDYEYVSGVPVFINNGKQKVIEAAEGKARESAVNSKAAAVIKNNASIDATDVGDGSTISELNRVLQQMGITNPDWNSYDYTNQDSLVEALNKVISDNNYNMNTTVVTQAASYLQTLGKLSEDVDTKLKDNFKNMYSDNSATYEQDIEEWYKNTLKGDSEYQNDNISLLNKANFGLISKSMSTQKQSLTSLITSLIGEEGLIKLGSNANAVLEYFSESILDNWDAVEEKSKEYRNNIDEADIQAKYTDDEIEEAGGWENLANEQAYSQAVAQYLVSGFNDSTVIQEIEQLATTFGTTAAKEAVYSFGTDSVNLTEAESAGLDTDELTEYSTYLQEVDKQGTNLSKELNDNKESANIVAKSIMRMNQGIETLTENIEDWADVLKYSNKTSKEYADAIQGITNSLVDMLDITQGASYITDDFVTNNLANIEKAANGDAEAIENLRKALATDIAVNLVGDDTEQIATIKTDIQNLNDWLANNEIKVGTEIDLDNLESGEQEFLNYCNQIIRDAGMTAEQANAFFDAMGFETTFATQPQEVHMTGQGTVTETTATGQMDVIGADGWVHTVPSSYETRTYPGEPYDYTNTIEVPAFTTSTDGKTEVPQIKTITKKASGSMNNYSSSNKGGKSSSSGSSKSTKNKSDEIERYHVIKEKLEDINEELDRISEAKDRAFGKSKIALMEQEVAEYDELIAKQKEYIAEIQSYYNSDAATMKGYGANIENGIITNYDALVGKYVDMYNAGSIDDDAYEAFKDALSNFEESSDLLSEQTDELIKLQNEKIDKLLAIVDEKVNLQLELNNDEMEYFDFLLETVADDAADAAEAIGLLGKKVSDLLENNEAYVQGIKDTLGVYGVTAQEAQGVLDGTADVNALVEKYGIDAQGVEQLKEYRDGLMDVAKELISLREEVYAKLNEVLDEFNEKMDNQINKIEQAQALMDHYKNIIDIVGKDKLGISDGVLKRMSDITVSNATGSLSIARQKKEENLKALQEAQDAYQKVLQTESEEDIKLMEEQLEELEDKVADATESWASSFESAIQVIQEAFTDAIQAAADKFDETMAGTYGNLEDLQDAYDKQKSLDDLTLDTYEKIYQLNKLNRDITNSIDDTDNIAGKQQLLELQKEINDAQASTTEMTQYEVDFLQKKYDLYLAQIALEEAQNAKNQVRMNRDNEGNWSYIYTADASATADAQQSYEDKLYELEKLNQDYIDTMQEQLLTSFAQYKEEIAALNLTDEERAALLEEYWNTLTEKYELYLNGALEDASWITDQVIGLDHELIDSYDETYLAKFTDTTSMMELDEEFKQASQQMISEVNAAYTEFENNTEMVMDAAGTSTTNFASTVEENMNSTVQKTEEAKNAASELQNEYSDAFSSAADSVSSFAQNYAKQMQTVITNTATSVDSINSLIKAIANLEGTTANTVSAVYGKVTTAANNAIAYGNEKLNSVKNTNGISLNTSWTAGSIRVSQGGGGSAKSYNGRTYIQGDSANGNTNWYLFDNNSVKNTGSSTNHGDYKFSSGAQYYTDEDFKKLLGLSTGGYTGEWGNSGRLAVLHQKELVLNADDTSNFLSAIEMVRDITKSIDLQAQSQGVGLGALSAAGIPSSSAFEQNVNIQASFPNATNHSEIEEAFNNLINRASQFAGRK